MPYVRIFSLTALDLCRSPLIPGHEIIGQVAAVGPGETKWKTGEIVGGGWHGGHDGHCRQCTHAQFQLCEKAVVNGVNMDGGCKHTFFFIRHTFDPLHRSSDR